MTAPESESKAYTESCSVATNTVLNEPVAVFSCDRYKGCASTLPSTFKVRSNPKVADATFVGVSVVSDRFCPVRLKSFL